MSVRRIAALAGVSAATVSMALHHNPRIPEVTRRRVLALARRFGYRPDAKIAALMEQVRLSRHRRPHASLGVISLYDHERPWENSLHLSRMYEGMKTRAEELGYDLEPLWLRGTGMSPRRLSEIIDSRGIVGLLSFGAPDMETELPPELDHYAIVTQGLSIKTALHRVINHAHNDTWHALDKMHQLGYRRPGLILGNYEDLRGGHTNVSAYLGWCECHAIAPLPVLRLNQLEEPNLLSWLKANRPDGVILVHTYDVLVQFAKVLRGSGIRIPDDLGVAALTQILKGTGLSGFEENQFVMGTFAVELLISRILSSDVGIPDWPRIEMVEGRWIDGGSLVDRR
jgi:LacI family transcriptional regulator